MVQQQQRLRPVPRALQARDDNGAAGARVVAFDRDTFALENAREEVRRFHDVAGRVRRVDPDIFLDRANRFRTSGLPIGAHCAASVRW